MVIFPLAPDQTIAITLPNSLTAIIQSIHQAEQTKECEHKITYK